MVIVKCTSPTGAVYALTLESDYGGVAEYCVESADLNGPITFWHVHNADLLRRQAGGVESGLLEFEIGSRNLSVHHVYDVDNEKVVHSLDLTEPSGNPQTEFAYAMATSTGDMRWLPAGGKKTKPSPEPEPQEFTGFELEI